MKDYGRLLGTPEAHAFSARVRDFSEWVAAQAAAPPVRPTGTVVVVQDPCHLRHVQHAHGAVRTVLAPAYELRRDRRRRAVLRRRRRVRVLQPELAGEIRDRKVAAIRAAARAGTRRVVVASANPGCAMHLARRRASTVRHPAELLAAALGDGPHDRRT